MYSLTAWTHPATGQIRLYVNGTTRSGVYLLQDSGGRVVWSSKTNDTPTKFRSGDHWGKVKKDGAAAEMVAERFGIPLGNESTADDWTRAVQIAADGIQLSSDEA